MGDLVQTLPALTDAAKAIPGIRFDFVVDESFAEIPAWHPNVGTVFPSAYRRWSRRPWPAWRAGEVGAFLRGLRAKRYDLIIDVQGELKSALAARLARGRRCGYDRHAIHEWGAQFAYQKKFFVPKGQHSIRRMRQLLARALEYSFDEGEVDYGVSRTRLRPAPVDPAEPYLVFIHSTSWISKNWAQDYWRELSGLVTKAGFFVILPWGSELERERARRISTNNDKVIILPPLSISEKASIIAGAQATVGLDTGLSHIAAAFDVPSVTIYGATDPALVGATGRHQTYIMSDFECVKCHEVECSYGGAVKPEPACLVDIRPAHVWQELQRLMKATSALAHAT